VPAPFGKEQCSDQEAADDEEDVYADIAADDCTGCQVEGHDEQDGERSQPIQPTEPRVSQVVLRCMRVGVWGGHCTGQNVNSLRALGK
jgi:hypothetical protein